MKNSKWEQYKMEEKYHVISIYEVLLILLGIEIFFFPLLEKYEFIFAIFVIVLYWFTVRYSETLVLKKKQEIYNVYYDKCQPIPMNEINKQVEKERKPMLYELEQLEAKRKFLIDKFIVISLILIVLLQL